MLEALYSINDGIKRTKHKAIFNEKIDKAKK